MAAPPTVTTTSGTTPTTTPTLAVRHLGKSFAGVAALEDVSLDLMPGSVHALVGGERGGQVDAHQADDGRLHGRHGHRAPPGGGDRLLLPPVRPAGRDRDDLPGGAPGPQLSVARNFSWATS